MLYPPPPAHPGAPFGSLARAALRSPSLADNENTFMASMDILDEVT